MGRSTTRARHRDPRIDAGVETLDGLEAEAVVEGDVQQGVVFADEHLLRLAADRHEPLRRRLGLLGFGLALLGLLRSGRGSERRESGQGYEQRCAAHAGSVAWLCALLASVAVGCIESTPPMPPFPPPIYVEETPPPPPPCERILRIEVHKSARELVAFCEGGAEERMTAAMGRERQGHKRARGDQRTPEGTYHISGTLERNRFYGFIPLDYPSLADANEALLEGRIKHRDFVRIEEAHTRGVQPPDDTRLGGGIGIHGEGRRWAGDSEHLDWTFGCVAVTDADLDFLAERLEVGVEVLILP